MKTDVVLKEREVEIQGDLSLTNSKFQIRRGTDVCTIDGNSLRLKDDSNGNPFISISNSEDSSTLGPSLLNTTRVLAKFSKVDQGVIKDLQIFGIEDEAMIPGKLSFKGPGNKILLEIDPIKQDIIFKDGSTLSSKLNATPSGMSSPNNNHSDRKTLTFKNTINPLIEIFTSGTANPDKMILAHSKDYNNWGLMYRDRNDSFHFNSEGNSVLSVDLKHKRVGINTENPHYDLHVTGTIASTQPIQTLSDGQYKREVNSIKNAINTVQLLNGIDFKWKEKIGNKDVSNKKQYGFIAQEVEKVIPELVHAGENGDKTVNYQGVIPFLVQAIKEQQKQLDLLQQKLKN